MSKKKVARLSLPSQHQIDDKVLVSFDKINFTYSEEVTADTINFEAIIIAVHFYPGKVKYDIEIVTPHFTTRVYNLDSILIFKK